MVVLVVKMRIMMIRMNAVDYEDEDDKDLNGDDEDDNGD